MPGFDYAGNVMPSGASRYQILEEIRGKYYHKYTSNIFASIGNFLFWKNSFIEKKPIAMQTNHSIMS